MLRKWLTAALLSLGLFSPLALTGSTQAFDRYDNHRHDHHTFRVYVRDCDREPWRFAGSYHHRDEAWRVARSYRVQGFEADVR